MCDEFYHSTSQILPAVLPENAVYKNQVGQTIYNFVARFIGPAGAPKVTGMLIDLSVEEIRKYLVNFDLFCQRIQQAQ